MILFENFCAAPSVSGIRKITDDINFLYNYCDLTDVDNMILSQSGSLSRCLEILNVRALVKELGLNLKISYKHRKPFCDSGFISISHSDTLAAVIWSPDTEISIDIEEISERITRIAKRAFSLPEIEFADNNLLKLNLLWNCKECVYKLAEIKGLDFKKQIRVFPFDAEGKINAELVHDERTRHFEFEYSEILNHSYVWGREIR
jgi:4'-phosphopantetheinyl transferase